MTNKLLNYKPLIEETKLRKDIQKRGIKQRISDKARKAAQNLVDSFHGDEVLSWKEKEHDGTFLNRLFVDILGYTKQDSPIRQGNHFTLATEKKDETKRRPDGIIGYFDVLDVSKGNSLYPDAFIELEDASYGFGSKKSDKGKGIDQAFEYSQNFMNPKHHTRFEVVTNFIEIRIYTENRIQAHSIDLRLLTKGDRLEQLFYFLAPQNVVPEMQITSSAEKKVVPPIKALQDEAQFELDLGLQISAARATEMGMIHTKLVDSGFSQQQADKTVVRLAFLMFADDTGIFIRGDFTKFLEMQLTERPEYRLLNLKRMFKAVDEKDSEIRNQLIRDFKVPYINGGLFHYIDGDMPEWAGITDEIINDIYDLAKDDWSKVNPIVFGSMYEGAMDKKTRHDIGAHYTSELNILKVVDSLFMDDLRTQFQIIKDSPNSVVPRLLAFKKYLSTLTFLDPACGSGNFLIVAYRELRKLEHAVIQEIFTNTKQSVDFGFGFADITTFGFNQAGRLTDDIEKVSVKTWQPLVGVEVSQFNGIEIGIPYRDEQENIKYNSYPVDIAKSGMWMMDHLMNMELSDILAGTPFVRIPLHTAANIVQSDALLIDWNEIVNLRDLNYILGNPPFVGAKVKKGEIPRTKLSNVFQNVKNVDNMDFVFGWYLKSFELLKMNPKIRVGLVSSNSIVQGLQAIQLRKSMIKYEVKIDFGYQTFVWDNNGASVFVVIIGFSSMKNKNIRKILHYAHETGEDEVNFINEYLLPRPWVGITSRKDNISGLPKLELGSLFLDNNNFRIMNSEYEYLLRENPELANLYHPFFGAKELLNSIDPKEYVLYLPEDLQFKNLSIENQNRILEILTNVKSYREGVSKEDRKLAKVPGSYKRDRYHNEKMLAIPRHSSGPRDILPMRFFDAGTMISDGVYQLLNADLWLFAILQSQLHVAWINIISGKLGESIRYSSQFLYNDFPIPKLSDISKKKLTILAKEILKEREFNYTQEINLADMYDREKMPYGLREIHKRLDDLVDNLYGVEMPNNEARFDAIIKLYTEYV